MRLIAKIDTIYVSYGECAKNSLETNIIKVKPIKSSKD